MDYRLTYDHKICEINKILLLKISRLNEQVSNAASSKRLLNWYGRYVVHQFIIHDTLYMSITDDITVIGNKIFM